MYEDGERWEEVRCLHFLHTVVFFGAVAVKLAIYGFGGERPWRLVPRTNIYTA